jgi:hypothetical protein
VYGILLFFFQDDKDCQKKFPSQYNREFKCPVTVDPDNLHGYAENQLLGQVNIDTTLLPTLLSGDANVCVILTRRSEEDKSFHKYFCNGEASLSPFETWSSSKIFAMANAAGSLRTEDACVQNEFGLDASTTGEEHHNSVILDD